MNEYTYDDFNPVSAEEIPPVPEFKYKSPKPKPKPRMKTEICRILWKKKTKFAISFKGYGTTIKGDIPASATEVLVEYVGEIGKRNFKITSYE